MVTSPNGTDGTVTVFAVPSGEVLTQRPAPCCGGTLGLGGQRIPRSFPGAVAWRGNDLYVASGTGTIEQWDPDNGRRLRTLGTDYPAAIDLRFVDDGTTLVLSGGLPSGQNPLMAYDADTGAALWDTPQSAGGSIAADPRHDALIVTDPYSGATMMQRFDLSTGEPIDTYDPRLGSGCFVEASPDGRVLAGFSCERSASRPLVPRRRRRGVATRGRLLPPGQLRDVGHERALRRPHGNGGLAAPRRARRHHG